MCWSFHVGSENQIWNFSVHTVDVVLTEFSHSCDVGFSCKAKTR